MSNESKRKVAFALAMGLLTTGIITFVLLAMNAGFTPMFAERWFHSWFIAYVIVVPLILFIGPNLQSRINRIIE